jgi:hypothetical protein
MGARNNGTRYGTGYGNFMRTNVIARCVDSNSPLR